MNKGVLLEKYEFIVLLEEPLTDYKRKVLTYLYLPIIKDKATMLYTTLCTYVNRGSQESSRNRHQQLMTLLGFDDDMDFIKATSKLEAIGLLDTYIKESTNTIVYNLKHIMYPEQFFKDPYMSQILKSVLGIDEYEHIVCEFLIRSIDLSTFEKISSTFDEEYVIEIDNQSTDMLNTSILYLNNDDNGVKINNDNFDVKVFQVLISSLDILDEEILVDRDFLETIKKYSFFYQLTTEEMKDAVVASVTVDKKIDMEKLNLNVRRIYDNKGKMVTIKPKTVMVNASSKTIQFLESNSPATIVKTKYKTPLTSAEIHMFDTLLINTGISLGVLNVLIIFVMENKNGEIPSYNYFLTIINRWKRAGVKTTEDALAYINGTHASQTSKPKTSKKKEKAKPEWYDDYSKDEHKEEEKVVESTESLDDLNDFFKPKK